MVIILFMQISNVNAYTTCHNRKKYTINTEYLHKSKNKIIEHFEWTDGENDTYLYLILFLIVAMILMDI